MVRGERRQKDSKKKKQEQADKPKRKYKKKDPNRVRLCCDDVMAKAKLIEYQDSYGEAMNKYGLIRGEKNSDARHITLTEFYRNQMIESRNLQTNIEMLLAAEDAKRLSIEELKRQEQEAEKLKQQKEMELKKSISYLEEEKQEVYEKVRDMYDCKDEAREKFLHIHEYTQQKEQEIAVTEARLEQLKQNYEPYKAQEDLNLLIEIFPQLSERLRIAQLCKGIGLTIDATKGLFNGESLSVTGKLHSPEYNQSFEAKDAKLQLFKDRDNPNKLKLSINGKNILDWFKEQFTKLTKKIRRPIIQPKQGGGIKM